MEAAHRLGMRTTATMMFGHVETLEERIDHLLHLRDLQDRTARLHRLHRLDLPALEHRDRRGRADLVPVPAHPGRGAGDARQLPERAGVLGHPGRQDRPGVAALRGERLRQPDDRGERGLGGGRRTSGSPRPRSRATSRHAGFVPKRRTMHYEIVGDPYCWSQEAPDRRPARQGRALGRPGGSGQAGRGRVRRELSRVPVFASRQG